MYFDKIPNVKPPRIRNTPVMVQRPRNEITVKGTQYAAKILHTCMNTPSMLEAWFSNNSETRYMTAISFFASEKAVDYRYCYFVAPTGC